MDSERRDRGLDKFQDDPPGAVSDQQPEEAPPGQTPDDQSGAGHDVGTTTPPAASDEAGDVDRSEQGGAGQASGNENAAG